MTYLFYWMMFIYFYRCVKYNLPNIPDFETLFLQTQEFINDCNGEHVRYATDSCKIAWFFTKMLTICFIKCIVYIHILECTFFSCLTVADLCHKFTQNLVDKKQVIYLLSMNMVHVLKYMYRYIPVHRFNRVAWLIPKSEHNCLLWCSDLQQILPMHNYCFLLWNIELIMSKDIKITLNWYFSQWEESQFW